ncbi:succinate-semialdehyde dehydrogenase / glutarate-semialdehyde dehydrogenase [Zhouia amylolytica]|uniref:Succinate-semialdehyde dehydrogenase / glutarate-semialdehyde dehydrogenase n=1 Tax=Zhouia amylolytica TaxID=376730 RepID=A0A1I6UPB5_9FLAO|nr:NAD-dependent succinate-semialdehyde dehydrogenase [Zhouia amylolytica]MCQ0110721.1 NAD-dependent succinate-semialdehyde dehydrogenase [Zhouia amylolytica]SFT03305.1 succinate-semialdehyde dehydrogenase / glutarate-semialdehyde dehydrogenase [Zhouia amylolytica]
MIQSINPYNNQLIKEFEELSEADIAAKIALAQDAFEYWKQTTFDERSGLLHSLADVLIEQKEAYGKIMALEVGKPIKQAIAEIEKCAWVCNYYAENGADFLRDELISTDADKSYVKHEPLGVLLAVMPWNYPFWQVFRFAAPAIMAGNVGLLKHASNVMMSAGNIEACFTEAGFPKGVFQNLIISSNSVAAIIEDERIKAVTLTGSKPAGSAVASTAAKKIKKSVLELGGSNAFIVLHDADIDKAVETGINARYQNTGQSCIAAKRFLLQKDIAEEFLNKFLKKVETLKSGNPLDEDTYIGTLAREDLAIELEKQLKASVDKGAKVLIGGKRCGAYFEPTVVTDVKEDMPVFSEETFGPLVAVVTFDTIEEAVELSNNSKFGLGVTLFTSDITNAEALVHRFDEGAVFINELVKSDPRLPFGGVKTSGFGRELSHHGIKEFVNVKTVFINK